MCEILYDTQHLRKFANAFLIHIVLYVHTAKGVKMQIYLLLNALIKLQKWSILLFAEI